MSDISQVLPLHIHPWTRWSIGGAARLVGGITNPASSTWVLNDAIYIPVHIPFQYPVNRVFWGNGTSATGTTHCDFGIFSPTGAPIFRLGSTAQAGTSQPQYVAPATPFILAPGRYYFGFWCDNATAGRVWAASLTAAFGVQVGLQTQAGLSGLPAGATFAAYTTGQLPVCGITRTISGF